MIECEIHGLQEGCPACVTEDYETSLNKQAEQFEAMITDLKAVLQMIKDSDCERYIKTGSFGVPELCREELERVLEQKFVI